MESNSGLATYTTLWQRLRRCQAHERGHDGQSPNRQDHLDWLCGIDEKFGESREARVEGAMR